MVLGVDCLGCGFGVVMISLGLTAAPGCGMKRPAAAPQHSASAPAASATRRRKCGQQAGGDAAPSVSVSEVPQAVGDAAPSLTVPAPEGTPMAPTCSQRDEAPTIGAGLCVGAAVELQDGGGAPVDHLPKRRRKPRPSGAAEPMREPSATPQQPIGTRVKRSVGDAASSVAAAPQQAAGAPSALVKRKRARGSKHSASPLAAASAIASELGHAQHRGMPASDRPANPMRSRRYESSFWGKAWTTTGADKGSGHANATFRCQKDAAAASPGGQEQFESDCVVNQAACRQLLMQLAPADLKQRLQRSPYSRNEMPACESWLREAAAAFAVPLTEQRDGKRRTPNRILVHKACVSPAASLRFPTLLLQGSQRCTHLSLEGAHGRC